MRGSRFAVAAVVCAVAVGGGRLALSRLDAGSETATALSGRTWLAVDHPAAAMPWLRFSGDADRLEVEGVVDGCNRLGGFVVLDGELVTTGAISSTAMSCGDTPLVAGMWTGSTMSVADDELLLTDTDGRSTRFVAANAFTDPAPGDLAGTYMLGIVPVTFGAGTVAGDGCERTWQLDGRSVALDGPACATGSPVASVLGVERWDAVARRGDVVLLEIGGRYVRLDRSATGAPALPAFLGAVTGRTWVLDPATPWQSARLPSLVLSPDVTFDGVTRLTGFDGCAAHDLTTRWEPSGAGWAVAVDGPPPTDPACAADGGRVAADGSFAVGAAGELVLTTRDGTVHTFVDVRRATLANGMQGPIPMLPGPWELDPGVVVGIGPPAAGGTGTITVAGCTVPWWGTGNEWIGAGPVPAGCADAATGATAALLRLLDTSPDPAQIPGPVALPITVGSNDDRSELYLASADGTIVLRLTRPA